MARKSTLQQEIRQRPPFRTDAQEATISILRTADVVRRRLAAAVEPHGITFQQYNVLRILRGAPARATLHTGDRRATHRTDARRHPAARPARGQVAGVP